MKHAKTIIEFLKKSATKRARSPRHIKEVSITMLFFGCMGLLFSITAQVYSITTRPLRVPEYRVLFPGVNYTKHVVDVPRKAVVHSVELDLTSRSFSYLVTPALSAQDTSSPAKKTTTFAAEYQTQIAINGSFYTANISEDNWLGFASTVEGERLKVLGQAISNGVEYSDNSVKSYPKLCIKNGVLKIQDDACPQGTQQALAGTHRFIDKGSWKDSKFDNEPLPGALTVIALTTDDSKAWLITVDGRQPGYSEGLTRKELADLLLTTLKLPIDTALNLDGGSSSTLVLNAHQKGPKILNSPIHLGFPMTEKPVANHLGIFIFRK